MTRLGNNSLHSGTHGSLKSGHLSNSNFEPRHSFASYRSEEDANEMKMPRVTSLNHQAGRQEEKGKRGEALTVCQSVRHLASSFFPHNHIDSWGCSVHFFLSLSSNFHFAAGRKIERRSSFFLLSVESASISLPFSSLLPFATLPALFPFQRHHPQWSRVR